MARHGEKKFTTWEYRENNIGPVLVSIPVLVVDTSKTSSSYHGTDAKTYFKVELRDLEISEKSSDINELRNKVFELIKQKLNIEWKNKLHVEVSCDRERLFNKEDAPDTPDTQDDGSGSLTVKWVRYQVAIVNGEKVQRQFRRYIEPMRWGTRTEPAREEWGHTFGDWPHEGVDPRDRSDTPSQAALIDDTPENRAALELIADNLELLYSRLSVLLNADKIQSTLTHVISGSSLLALAAPAETKNDKKA